MTPEELFENNKKLAYRHTNKLYNKANTIGMRSGFEKEDIEQIALIGLWKACRDFKPELGFKFSTYAIPKIHGEIIKEFRDIGNFIKVPRKIMNVYNKIKKTDRKYTLEEIMEEFKCSEKDAKAVLDYREFAYLSLNTTFQNDDNKEMTFEDMIEDDRINIEEDFIINSELNKRLSILNEKERIIITMLLEGDYTQKEIGKKIGVHQVQVSRLYKMAMKKLESFNEKIAV